MWREKHRRRRLAVKQPMSIDEIPPKRGVLPRDDNLPTTNLLGDLMSHLVAFGRQVLRVVLVHRWQDWNLIDDFEIESAKIERFGLLGVVGQQPHLVKPEVFEDLNSNTVVTHVGFVAQCCVCLLYTSPSPRDATLSRMPSSA